jgi:hypothetical protein
VLVCQPFLPAIQRLCLGQESGSFFQAFPAQIHRIQSGRGGKQTKSDNIKLLQVLSASKALGSMRSTTGTIEMVQGVKKKF